MGIGLRHCCTGTAGWLKARLGAGDCARTFLARGLCGREGWRNAKGEPCPAPARAALPKLSPAPGLPLPEARPTGGVTPASPAPSPDFPDRRLSCALEDPGGAAVVPAAGEDRAPARSMMAPHRPEGGAACFRPGSAAERSGGAPPDGAPADSPEYQTPPGAGTMARAPAPAKARNRVRKRRICGPAALPERVRAVPPAGGRAGTAETGPGNRGIAGFSGRHYLCRSCCL